MPATLVFATAALAYQLHAPAAVPMAAATRRMRDAKLVEGLDVSTGELPTTIGAAKDGFYDAYKRPVNSMQQQFVNEMLTGTTLAYVHKQYKPSRVFYLGFVTLCDIFLASVQNEAEREKIFTSMCAGLQLDAVKLRKEADALKSAAEGKTEE